MVNRALEMAGEVILNRVLGYRNSRIDDHVIQSRKIFSLIETAQAAVELMSRSGYYDQIHQRCITLISELKMIPAYQITANLVTDCEKVVSEELTNYFVAAYGMTPIRYIRGFESFLQRNSISTRRGEQISRSTYLIFFSHQGHNMEYSIPTEVFCGSTFCIRGTTIFNNSMLIACHITNATIRIRT